MNDRIKDGADRQRDRTREFSRMRAESRLDRAMETGAVRREVDRIAALPPDGRTSLERVRDQSTHGERLRQGDPLSRFPGYDLQRALAAETREIRSNPVGFIRCNLERGLDRHTEYELKISLESRR